ncbi:MAG: cardiolipin synthase B [Acidobacteriaceae bacterium]|nr:cardiolipin synthase B [Acidobacteriaceae bacterium]
MHTTFLVLALIAIASQGLVLVLAFFGPDLPYRIKHAPDRDLASDSFLSLLAVLTDAQVHRGTRIEVLTNGERFYTAQLAAIRAAQRTINLEAYIFHRGKIGDQFVEALAERARSGVKVQLIIDYIGSLSTTKSYFRKITDAGGRVEWYHSLRIDLLPQINNRTHREMLIVDGKVGFVGGAGIADQWYTGLKGHARWRDTAVRLEGPLVPSLQSAFAQNWLRVSGEILTGSDYFSFDPREHADRSSEAATFVVNSTPAAGSTRARILFQTLIASAKERIYINTPYFLPDRSARQAIIEAARDRKLDVKIITPGKHADHALTRNSSRTLYGALLKNGVEIYEYQPSMIHVKALIVDDMWAVVGSTNFDSRSFELNDEVNVAFLDRAVTGRLVEDFHRDLAQSQLITYKEWGKRARFRVYERLESLLAKQE